MGVKTGFDVDDDARCKYCTSRHLSHPPYLPCRRITAATYGSVAAGVAGRKGEAGDKGDRGAVGDRGPRGERGEEGEKGVRGSHGATGATGRLGATGPIGSTGPVGATGRPGLLGVQGWPGVPGIFYYKNKIQAVSYTDNTNLTNYNRQRLTTHKSRVTTVREHTKGLAESN